MDDKIIYLLFLILFILFFYLIYKINNLENKNIENFDITTDIKTAINAQYAADLESIRNLSNLASALTTNGNLTCPGGLKINNGTTTYTSINTDGSAGFANGKVKINNDGSVSFANGNVTIDADGNLTVSKDINVKGGWVRIYGNNGIYWQNWGGGWNMTDSTWIRTYGGKHIYSDQSINIDGEVNTTGLYFKNYNNQIHWPVGPSGNNRDFKIYGHDNGHGCQQLMFCESTDCASMDDGHLNARQGPCN